MLQVNCCRLSPNPSFKRDALRRPLTQTLGFNVATYLIAFVFALAIWVVLQVIKNHSPSFFSSKVSGALFDLGLQVMKLEPQLNQIYIKDCLSYYESKGKQANPYEMATHFFLKAVIDYPAFAERAIMFDGFIIRSIKVVKSWRKSKVSDAVADDFLIKIKTFLIDGLKNQPMEEDVKIATEIQILEL